MNKDTTYSPVVTNYFEKSINVLNMDKELKVIEFNKKKKLVDFVNENSEKLDILQITSSCEGISHFHFLWYYQK